MRTLIPSEGNWIFITTQLPLDHWAEVIADPVIDL